MSHRRLLIATRSRDKLREIRQILADLPDWEILGLRDLGIQEEPAEADLEQFDTFEANALAKARYFAARAGMPVLADDSGLCVDALGGAPGVRSKRFSGRTDLTGRDLDRINNAHLLRLLADVELPDRTARYVCAAAVVDQQGREEVFLGTCDGVILREPQGSGGFGYDPLFFLPAEEATFGELDPRRKNAISHRARAIHTARAALARWGDTVVSSGSA
ncbi:MAG TPA: RdgB/HAM1 family non-canonical purine NTP pyrophosphatase [Longimicrobiaceae bacterium]|nr:RdgB/HAM1 family non-canonical purine NTP pyrophosphatase [Longimicrobiaceae bacterium]